jgi:hypothetical protein
MGWREVGQFNIAGKACSMRALTGQIVDRLSQSVTHVSGSGSDREVHVSAISGVDSTLFVVDQEGIEHSVSFRTLGKGVGVRSGHKVTIFTLYSDLLPAKVRQPGVHYMMYNHNTRQHERLISVNFLGGMDTGVAYSVIPTAALALAVVIFDQRIAEAFLVFIFPGLLFYLGGAFAGQFVIAPNRMKALAREYQRISKPVIETAN